MTSRDRWIKETAEELLEPFADGFQWEDFVDLIPIARNKVILAMALGLIRTNRRDRLARDLLHEIIDTTDGWGPDAIIDPVLKAATTMFLLGEKDEE